MLKLMQLEWKKTSFWSVFRRFGITAIIMLGFMMLVYFDSSNGDANTVLSFNQIVGTFGALMFCSTVLNKFMVEQYNNQSINIMFSYPISRTKLWLAKMLTIWLITIVAINGLFLLLSCAALILSQNVAEPAISLNIADILHVMPNVLLNSILYCGGLMLPMFLGVWRKSTVVTIVSTIVMAGILNSQIGDFSFSDLIIIPCIIAVIGFVLAYVTLRQMKYTDF